MSEHRGAQCAHPPASPSTSFRIPACLAAHRRAVLVDDGCGDAEPRAARTPNAGAARWRAARPARPGGGQRPRRRCRALARRARCRTCLCSWSTCLCGGRVRCTTGSSCRACGLPGILSIRSLWPGVQGKRQDECQMPAAPGPHLSTCKLCFKWTRGHRHCCRPFAQGGCTLWSQRPS